MIVLGIDLGNKSRNAIAVVNESHQLLDYSCQLYDGSISVLEHRKNICNQIQEYINKYNLTKDDYIIFEKINLFVGSRVSKLANITSLAFIQATIINEFSDKITIVEVNVQTWKNTVLGSRSATKEDSVNYVEKNYPKVDLDVFVLHKCKADEIVKNNDLSDAVCIGVFGHIGDKKKIIDNIVNYT